MRNMSRKMQNLPYLVKCIYEAYAYDTLHPSIGTYVCFYVNHTRVYIDMWGMLSPNIYVLFKCKYQTKISGSRASYAFPYLKHFVQMLSILGTNISITCINSYFDFGCKGLSVQIEYLEMTGEFSI